MRERHFVYRESIRFFMITKQLHDLLDECNEIQKEAIDLLLSINNGKIHPILINPQQLQLEITKIRELIPDKFILPGKNSGTELKEIWHLLTGTGLFVGSQLVIDLKIPLFNRQSSQIYKIVPVPFIQDGVALMAKIKSPYIVYNYEIDSFHFLTDAVLNECKRTLSQELVCEENFPWIDAAKNECELSPLKPHTIFNCKYEEIEKLPFWIELHIKGNWLFKTFKETSAHIKCSNQQQMILELPRQGILTLYEDCTARIDDVTLVAVHKMKDRLSSKFQSFLTRDANVDKDNFIKPLGNVLVNHDQEISKLKTHVEELKKQNIKLRDVSFHQRCIISSLC
ncbi:uncharacterized protein LOC119600794 [Lucilia sericata]|uniref:uncharacterized protein LOC119600794 n=1 Tax=Lucilia sericata TaxID=13632 RepID=UPI0018A81A37|nr:uncharacterized protein LOC119600794 [Lucilia sericata]